MIEIKNCSVFNSGCEAIINTVNCVGVMGAGLALEFSLRYPELNKQYKTDCLNKLVKIGTLIMYDVDGQKIINFPTKIHWRYPSKLEWIEKGLDFIVNHFKEWNINSLAVPPLGCGLGGLDFNSQVLPLIKKKLNSLPIKIIVCL